MLTYVLHVYCQQRAYNEIYPPLNAFERADEYSKMEIAARKAFSDPHCLCRTLTS